MKMVKCNGVLIGALVMIAGLCYSAVPSAEACNAATRKLRELTAADYSALKKGTKQAEDVGDALVAYAGKVDDPVECFVLLREAFRQYVNGRAYGKAADVYRDVFVSDGADVAVALAESVQAKLAAASSSKNPVALKLYLRLVSDGSAVKRIKELEDQLKDGRAPKAAQLRLELGNEYVACGDWESALTAYSKSTVAMAKVARWELGLASEDMNAAQAAAFWWSKAEENKNRQPVFQGMRSHAAEFYREAIVQGAYSGSDLEIANGRVKKSEGYDIMLRNSDWKEKMRLYCVIDISGGPSATRYPVSYLRDAPKGGWSDEYKTTKIVFRKVEAGSCRIGNSKNHADICLTRAFYVGVFEVTQRQWELVKGNRPSYFRQNWELRPVESVSWHDIRGRDKGAQYPAGSEVDDDSFVSLIRQKSGLSCDLPTEAEWEYACRAGTTSDYNDGTNISGEGWKAKVGSLCRSYENGWNEKEWGRNAGEGKWSKFATQECDEKFCSAKVGMYAPNNWGLYDMHGNVGELCLDWFKDGGRVNATDPSGPQTGTYRVRRGGCWRYGMDGCASHSCHASRPDVRSADIGFRLALH